LLTPLGFDPLVETVNLQ